MSVNTKIVYVSHYTQFAKYLGTLGFAAFIPERPIDDKRYAPYLFSDDEISRLFGAADSIAENTGSRKFAGIEFPLILRLLYGCGLRLREVFQLQVADVDLQTGVLLIINAKGNKDRLVPMDSSLTEILRSFIISQRSNAPTGNYLFSNRKGEPFATSSVTYL